MLKLSLDNPFTLSLGFIFFGMLGYIYQTDSLNEFDITFSALMFFLFLFLLFLGEYIERKKFPSEVRLNLFFCWFVFFVKFITLIMMILAGPVGNFDDRLSIFGSSLILGVNNALTVFLFPIIPALTKNRFLFWACLVLWAVSSAITLIYAPSKSFAAGLIFSLLFYRFLKRKVYGRKKRIPIFSLKSIFISLGVISLTFLLVYSNLGSEAAGVLLHRVSYNYDIAIYISSIYENSSPDYGVIYYSLLPLLKQFDQSLYDLQFFSIPQWVVYEALGLERYGRFGYPNDNFAAGLLVSYGAAMAVVLFVISFSFWLFYVAYTLKKKKVGLFFLYLIFQIPLFYASLQDFSIYFFVVSFTYIAFFVCSFALKGVCHHGDKVIT